MRQQIKMANPLMSLLTQLRMLPQHSILGGMAVQLLLCSLLGARVREKYGKGDLESGKHVLKLAKVR